MCEGDGAADGKEGKNGGAAEIGKEVAGEGEGEGEGVWVRSMFSTEVEEGGSCSIAGERDGRGMSMGR